MSWCTITVRTTPHPALRQGTLILEVADEPMVEGFVRVLRHLPWEHRGWDAATGHWWVHATHRAALCDAALAHYDEVYLIEGPRTTDLKTGRVTEQLTMFDAEDR
jgi:hypothetical protein